VTDKYVRLDADFDPDSSKEITLDPNILSNTALSSSTINDQTSSSIQTDDTQEKISMITE
jgi:hypothetical protein